MDGALVAIMMADQAKAHELADRLSARGHRPWVAEGSESLYEKAGEETIDVLVVANQLRSFFTGLDIVERLGAECVLPVTVLLAPEAMREDATAKRLNVYHIEPASVSVEALVELTLSAAQKSLLSRPFVCPRAQRLVSQAEGIEPLSPTVLKIANSLRETLACPDELLSELAADPMASAAVLKVVNSNAIGRAKKTASVEEGIRFLGGGRTISTVLSAGLQQNQKRLISRAPKEIRRWYSGRSLLIAQVAEAVATNLEHLPPEHAYIHGLLQDAGILILAGAHGERYIRLLDRVKGIPHLRLDAEERNQFGTSHADVTAALLRRLNLSERLAKIVGCHHDVIDSLDGDTAGQAMVRAMQIGEAVANLADRPSPQCLMVLNFLLEKYHGLGSDLCSETLVAAVLQIAELSEVFDLPVPGESELARLVETINTREKHVPGADFSPYHSAPAQEETESPAPEEPTAGTDLMPAGSRSKVLVLEDDSSIAKLVGKALAAVGVEPIHAECIDDALEQAGEVDAVICDVHIGREDGAAAISRLRSEGYAGPVIVISGDSSRSTVERVLKGRVSEYLVKPFSREQLLEKMQKYVQFVRESETSPRGEPAVVSQAS